MVKTEVIEKMAILITGAFALVAALAWNGAIKSVFKHLFGDASSMPAMLIYAVTVTIIAVFATIWIGKISERAKARKK